MTPKPHPIPDAALDDNIVSIDSGTVQLTEMFR